MIFRRVVAREVSGAKLGGELRTEMAALETRLTNRIYAIAIGLSGLVATFGLFT